MGVKRALIGAACGMAMLAPLAVAQTGFRDDGGREIALPAKVEKVWPSGPPAEALTYILAPEKLIGWTRAPSPEAQAFMSERYASLPVIGRLTGRGNTASLEAVVKAAPDLILDVGTVGPTYVSLADRVQTQTHIPYVLIGGPPTCPPQPCTRSAPTTVSTV